MGLAGVVVDGAVRDIEELQALRFPVFAPSSCPNGSTKNIPSRVNWPISAVGVTVCPGDLRIK
jgi:regulator of RNase E activity RraA